MVELLRISPLRHHSQRILEQRLTLSSGLKLLLLFHRLLLDHPEDSPLVLELLGRLQWRAEKGIDALLTARLAGPYRLYLQRRALLE